MMCRLSAIPKVRLIMRPPSSFRASIMTKFSKPCSWRVRAAMTPADEITHQLVIGCNLEFCLPTPPPSINIFWSSCTKSFKALGVTRADTSDTGKKNRSWRNQGRLVKTMINDEGDRKRRIILAREPIARRYTYTGLPILCRTQREPRTASRIDHFDSSGKITSISVLCSDRTLPKETCNRCWLEMFRWFGHFEGAAEERGIGEG